jgi:oxygen-dependent protoporphyrinogen oxidase
MRCDPPLPHLTSGKFSSVTVVNLVFDASPEHIHPSGFGYLVPRAGPSLRRSELENAILGTVFDSATLAGQEEDSSNLTKLTVMLGGPHRMPEKIDISSLLKVLRSHLGHEIPAPVGNLVHQNTNCIPIPGVGHLERMAQLKNVLLEQPWNGRLALAGASVDGVSVGDCIESGRRAALAWS